MCTAQQVWDITRMSAFEKMDGVEQLAVGSQPHVPLSFLSFYPPSGVTPIYLQSYGTMGL